MQLLLASACLMGLAHSAFEGGVYNNGVWRGPLLPEGDTTYCSLCTVPNVMKVVLVQVGEPEARKCDKPPGKQCTQHTIVPKVCPNCRGDTAVDVCGNAPAWTTLLYISPFRARSHGMSRGTGTRNIFFLWAFYQSWCVSFHSPTVSINITQTLELFATGNRGPMQSLVLVKCCKVTICFTLQCWVLSWSLSWIKTWFHQIPTNLKDASQFAAWEELCSTV
jgi:hypothetical protein